MCKDMIFVSFSDLILYDSLEVHPCLSKWPSLFLCYGWVIFHCIVHIYHIFFVHSSVHGHLDCFHIPAVVKSASVNTGVRTSFGTVAFSGYKPSSGTAGSYGGILLISEPERYYSSELLQCTQFYPPAKLLPKDTQDWNDKTKDTAFLLRVASLPSRWDMTVFSACKLLAGMEPQSQEDSSCLSWGCCHKIP